MEIIQNKKMLEDNIGRFEKSIEALGTRPRVVTLILLVHEK